MSVSVVIPVKGLAGSKTRLASALEQDARQTLVHAMAAHVVSAARAASNVGDVVLVGPDRHGLPDSIPLLGDPGDGLNAALASALTDIAGRGATRVVIVAGDLPQVTANDIQLLAAAPEGEVAIAPDRHGTGTNALSLPLPQASGFAFAFGQDSYARHHDAALEAGLVIETIHSLGLARDVDEPSDLADADALLAEKH